MQFSGDLSGWEQALVILLLLVSCALLALEFRQGKRFRWGILATGLAGALFLALTVARPVRVEIAGEKSDARVLVLVDGSERMQLPADAQKSRKEKIAEILDELREQWGQAQLQILAFGDGQLASWNEGGPWQASDLTRAVEELNSLPAGQAETWVVVSDGRLASPGSTEGTSAEAEFLSLNRARRETQLHTVRVTERVPRDRSIRSVRTTAWAVAHQALPVLIDLGCEPVDQCPSGTVIVRELLENAEPTELARGTVNYEGGSATLELPITLNRAGSRVLEIQLEHEGQDEIPANDRRFIPIEVRRDRIRILHVAGRPTYDVRALRMFLKNDESLDLIAFFILRTMSDRVMASDSELALIPFPVEELFTEHLPSFDAIILQDIDADQYGLARHFPALRDYVRKGGGLILVGGPGAFAAGGYAESPLEEVLPVRIPALREAVDLQKLEPRLTAAGQVAPVLAALRRAVGTRLPVMTGTNLVGPAKPTALVLWEHPDLSAWNSEEPLPLLTLYEAGDGRSIALTLDGTHTLRFGEWSAEGAGRAHTALWEGLLGWLMRDPRYEAARIEMQRPCFAGHPLELQVTPLPGPSQTVEMTVEALGSARRAEGSAPLHAQTKEGSSGKPLAFRFPELAAGGYVARARVGEAPPTRLVFACEEGGGTWQDSRPDPERLIQIAQQSGGKSVAAHQLASLPEPTAPVILSRSVTTPWVPDWVWASAASLLLAAHYLLRRGGGLS